MCPINRQYTHPHPHAHIPTNSNIHPYPYSAANRNAIHPSAPARAHSYNVNTTPLNVPNAAMRRRRSSNNAPNAPVRSMSLSRSMSQRSPLPLPLVSPPTHTTANASSHAHAMPPAIPPLSAVSANSLRPSMPAPLPLPLPHSTAMASNTLPPIRFLTTDPFVQSASLHHQQYQQSPLSASLHVNFHNPHNLAANNTQPRPAVNHGFTQTGRSGYEMSQAAGNLVNGVKVTRTYPITQLLNSAKERW